MKVITISGKAGAGKDTVAQIIKENLETSNENVLITHYADLLKYICKIFFNWDGQKDEVGRHLLQYVGTELIRAENPNFWVDFIAKMLKYSKHRWDYVIIPDLRFPNELYTLKSYGFNVIHLEVTRKNSTSTLTEAQKQHISETAMDEIIPDYEIKNIGTIEDLKSEVSELVRSDLRR